MKGMVVTSVAVTPLVNGVSPGWTSEGGRVPSGLGEWVASLEFTCGKPRQGGFTVTRLD